MLRIFIVVLAAAYLYRVYCKTKILSLLLIFGWGTWCSGQAPLFTQYFQQPVYMNPAFQGLMQGSWRAQVAYRKQFAAILGAAAFKTTSASVDFRIPVLNDGFIAPAILLLQDGSNGSGSYRMNQGMTGLAYHLALNKGGRGQAHQYLSAGFQAGIRQYRLNPDGLWFSSQVVGGRPDLNLPANDPFTNTALNSNLLLDANAGLSYTAAWSETKSFYAGIALGHPHSPQIAWADQRIQVLTPRWSAQIGGEIPLGRDYSLLPSAYGWLQNAGYTFQTGTQIRVTRFDLNEIALRAGLWTRISHHANKNFLSDALLGTVAFEYNEWMLGLSYDLTWSLLREGTNGRGAFELTLQYQAKPAERREKVLCPKF